MYVNLRDKSATLDMKSGLSGAPKTSAKSPKIIAKTGNAAPADCQQEKEEYSKSIRSFVHRKCDNFQCEFVQYRNQGPSMKGLASFELDRGR
jgi:hypothetical protein